MKFLAVVSAALVTAFCANALSVPLVWLDQRKLFFETEIVMAGPKDGYQCQVLSSVTGAVTNTGGVAGDAANGTGDVGRTATDPAPAGDVESAAESAAGDAAANAGDAAANAGDAAANAGDAAATAGDVVVQNTYFDPVAFAVLALSDIQISQKRVRKWSRSLEPGHLVTLTDVRHCMGSARNGAIVYQGVG
ncbi:hypothetical protein B0H16DRAFT_1461937 [Mycena metata]|uniref:Uncharacterized protein n=1 Tax=Mycena metata TaxID=1033252 RepID=A0AAD7IPM9_9AGAR|nr:hypothetical protein B0H16DRAFT_1461937 [Mycena metata]